MNNVILFGPDSEVYNDYAAVSPAPASNGAGGPPAYRHIRPLGTQLVLQDGRKFRFAASGGSTLVVGNVLTAGVATASQQNLATVATAIGARQLSVTTGASTAVNVFAEGYATISVTPGLNDMYKIASHLLQTSGAGDLINLWPGHAVRTALTTASKVDLIDNPYSRVIQSPATTLASAVVGVAVSAPVTLRGCWIQTRGPAAALTSGTAIAGTRGIAGLGTAGTIGPETATAATSAVQVTIAICMYAAASGAGSTWFLTIDG